jgi:hypothetical protein
MTGSRLAAIAALLLVMDGWSVAAQAPFQYREYTLETGLAAVIAVNPLRMTNPRTLHERPASIQEVVWRAPYLGLQGVRGEQPDPVQEMLFTFYNDELYQIVVTYNQGRMAGLTEADVVATLSETYGVSLLRDTRAARTVADADVRRDMAIVAQWDDDRALLTLVRGTSTYSPQFQLVLISKRLNRGARAAIVEAQRLDALDTPRRERERQAQAAAAAEAADQKARDVNKAAFRP